MSDDSVAAPSDVWHVMRTASAVRRFRPEPVADEIMVRCLEAATWAPSGSNEQPWRFVVVTSQVAKALIAAGFRAGWDAVRDVYGFGQPDPANTARGRMIRSMTHLVDNAADVPAFVLFCVRLHDGAITELLEGASIYPAMQNFLLAARAEGLGAVTSSWFSWVEHDLGALIGLPDGWRIASLVSVGWPQGGHVPVRRRPVAAVTSRDHWDTPLIAPLPGPA